MKTTPDDIRLFILARQRLFAHQGTLVADWRRYRGRRLGPYFRLAWREDGQQRSLYLGRSLPLARNVNRVLDTLQQPLRQQRCLRRLASRARASLRAERARCNQLLAPLRLYFKGSEIRGWSASIRLIPPGPPPRRSASSRP